jgi:hypothetical protein
MGGLVTSAGGLISAAGYWLPLASALAHLAGRLSTARLPVCFKVVVQSEGGWQDRRLTVDQG